MMLEELRELKEKALQELEGISNSKELESWHIKYLGKKGRLTVLMRGIGRLPPQERPAAGRLATRSRPPCRVPMRPGARL